MRIVTWNVNGLGSFKFPFIVHAHHTHAYPQAEVVNATSSPFSAVRQASTGSCEILVTEDENTPLDPRAPDFPAFPSKKQNLQLLRLTSFAELIDYFNADILCIQEVKIGRNRLDLLREYAFHPDFDSYWSFCKKRSGYSGTATFTRMKTARPVRAEEGISGILTTPNDPSAVGHNSTVINSVNHAELREIDTEGRCVITDHGSFVLFNLYVPNAGDDREDFKLRFLNILFMRITELKAAGRSVFLAGDLNIALTPLDHCAPEPYRNVEGQLFPFESSPARMWLANQISPAGGKFVDLFRLIHPTQRKAYTVWNTLTNSRTSNYGTRIDYLLAPRDLIFPDDSSCSGGVGACVDCRLLSYVEGSDHCPVQCDLDDTSLLQTWECGINPPSLAACFWPDFQGQQRSLKSFFSQSAMDEEDTQSENSRTDSELIVTSAAVVSQKSNSRLVNTKQSLGNSKSTSKKRKLEAAPKGKQSLLSYFKPVAVQPIAVAPSVSLSSNVSTHENPASPAKSPSLSQPITIDDTSDDIDPENSTSSSTENQATWFGRLQSGGVQTMNCTKHKIPCSRFRVNKKGPNQGREFFCCAIPPPDRCPFWMWINDAKRLKRMKEEDGEQNVALTNLSPDKFVSARSLMSG